MARRTTTEDPMRPPRPMRTCRSAWALAALVVIALAPAVADADPPAVLPDVSGLWAARIVTAATSDVPVAGEVRSRTTALQLVKVEQDGRRLELVTRTCDLAVRTSADDTLRTRIPRRFVQALPVSRRPAVLRRTAGRLRLLAPRHTTVLGARLGDADGQRLPTEADDPRVSDPDGDGHPGVTIEVRGLIDGAMYIVQRGWDALSGGLAADGDRISGSVRWGTEQVVLGSTSVFLGDPPPSKPDLADSQFVMARVADDTTCESLRQRTPFD